MRPQLRPARAPVHHHRQNQHPHPRANAQAQQGRARRSPRIRRERERGVQRTRRAPTRACRRGPRATQGVAPFAAANPTAAANRTPAADDARGKRPTPDPFAGLGRQPPSGLERAAKRPALDPSASSTSASASATGEDAPKLETLSADELRAFLRARGVTGAAVAIAGKAALLSQARLAEAKPIVHPPNGAR